MLRLLLLASALLLGSLARAEGSHSDRDYSLVYDASISHNDFDGGSATSSTISGAFKRNYGYFEFGGGIGFRSSGDYNNESLSLIGTYNFIENRAGNDFIPYVDLSLGAGTGTGTYSSRYAGGKLGIKWFPFGEIFSVNAGIDAVSMDQDFSEGPVHSNIIGGFAGWSLYF